MSEKTPAEESMTAAVTTAVVDAIQKRDREHSDQLLRAKADELVLEKSAKRIIGARDLVVAVGFFAVLIGGASVTFAEMRAKPSGAEVTVAIDKKVDPVISRLEPVEESVATLQGNVERLRQRQEMQMQHAEWRAEVADCRARSSCKRAPSEPQSLKDKKRELMTSKPARGRGK